MLHNFVVFVAKNFWAFISYTVHRNKLIDKFINSINGVINKNISLFFFPSDVKLAWKGKQKQRELTKNQLFFISLFFLKIQDIRKSKTPVFERGERKKFLGQVLTIFQAGPGQRGDAIYSLLSSSSTRPETFRLLSFICSFAFKMTSFYFQLQSL